MFFNKKVSLKPRIFMGVNEIAGYYKSLSKGFQEMGYRADFHTYFVNRFQYHAAENQFILVRWLIQLDQLKEKTTNSKLKKNIQKIRILLSWVFFGWCLFHYDVFIFSYKTALVLGKKNLFDYVDLPILKKFGKKIIYVFHGSDSRPPYLSGAFSDYTDNALISQTKRWKNQITAIECWADYIINHPPTSQFHERPIIQWLHIGIPFINDDESVPTTSTTTPYSNSNDPIRILHAPSRPIEKGTEIIRSVIAELIQEGYKIDYIELIDKVHSEVLLEIQKADFIVDEIYSDTPMAGLATEAAWFGKPSIVCGYEIDQVVSELDLKFVPPSLWGLPTQLKHNIQRLLDFPQFRQELGSSAQRFVQEQWDSKRVAERFLRLIANDVPPEWYFNPQNNNYICGWGLNHNQLHNNLERLICIGGKEALQLSDKLNLEKRVLDSVLACN